MVGRTKKFGLLGTAAVIVGWLSIALFASCPEVVPPVQLDMPTFSPDGGAYASAQTVTISAAEGASIRYTTDGSTPTSAVGTLYEGPVGVSSSMTITAISYRDGAIDSPSATATYTIAPPAFDGIALSSGVLVPPFDPAVFEYYCYVPTATTSLSVLSQFGGVGIAVSVNGMGVAACEPSAALPLNMDENTIAVRVDSEGASQTYSITVNRGFCPEAFLKASNGVEYAHFGEVLAADGDTLVVGAPTYSMPSTTNSNCGAVYVFRLTESGWIQEAFLTAPNADRDDKFGISVDVSTDTLVVGAFQEDNDCRTVVAGAPTEDDNDLGWSGAAYVYRRSAGQWELEAYLKAFNADAGDNFGRSVAIEGDIIAVGAVCEFGSVEGIFEGPDLGTLVNLNDNAALYSGAVYTYERDAGTWAPTAYIKAPIVSSVRDGNDKYIGIDDWFGRSVAMSGNTLVVCAKNESSGIGGVTNGNGVGSGDYSAWESGAVFVYRHEAAGWIQEAYIKAPLPHEKDVFGDAVAIDGDTLIVGASGAGNQPGLLGYGAVYTYVRSAGLWAFEASFSAPVTEFGQGFGRVLAIRGATIVVGTAEDGRAYRRFFNVETPPIDDPVDSVFRSSGAAYVFRREAGACNFSAFLKAPNAWNNGSFGSSAAIVGTRIAIGASGQHSGFRGVLDALPYPEDQGSPISGAVYIVSDGE